MFRNGFVGYALTQIDVVSYSALDSMSKWKIDQTRYVKMLPRPKHM